MDLIFWCASIFLHYLDLSDGLIWCHLCQMSGLMTSWELVRRMSEKPC